MVGEIDLTNINRLPTLPLVKAMSTTWRRAWGQFGYQELGAAQPERDQSSQ